MAGFQKNQGRGTSLPTAERVREAGKWADVGRLIGIDAKRDLPVKAAPHSSV